MPLHVCGGRVTTYDLHQSILSYNIGSGDHTHVVGFGDKYLYPLCPLAQPQSMFLVLKTVVFFGDRASEAKTGTCQRYPYLLLMITFLTEVLRNIH